MPGLKLDNITQNKIDIKVYPAQAGFTSKEASILLNATETPEGYIIDRELLEQLAIAMDIQTAGIMPAVRRLVTKGAITKIAPGKYIVNTV